MTLATSPNVGWRRALALGRAAVARAQAGEAHALEVDVPPRPLLAQLLEDGALARAVVLLARDGGHGRIVVLPRREQGAPTISELLESDHIRLDDIADRMSKVISVDPMRAVVLAHLFSAGIRRHVAAEEAILFPAFEARLGAASRQTAFMEREHRAILHYIERLLGAAERVLDTQHRDDGIEDLLRTHRGLVGVLADHNEREERSLFPLLDRTLREDDKNEILRRLVLF